MIAERGWFARSVENGKVTLVAFASDLEIREVPGIVEMEGTDGKVYKFLKMSTNRDGTVDNEVVSWDYQSPNLGDKVRVRLFND